MVFKRSHAILPVNQLKELSLNYAKIKEKKETLQDYKEEAIRQESITKNTLRTIKTFEARIMQAVEQGQLQTVILRDYIVMTDYAKIVSDAIRAIQAQGLKITIKNGKYEEPLPETKDLPTHPIQMSDFLYTVTADWSEVNPSNEHNMPDYEEMLKNLTKKVDLLSALCQEAEEIIKSEN